MKQVIDLQDVSWRREQELILSNINWQVLKNEHWVLLGLNGSGKTSLLKIITGYSWPTDGRVKILNRLFGKTDIRELRKSIGWVSTSLQERFKGSELAENIVVSGRFASTGLEFDTPNQADFNRAYHLMEQLGCHYLYGRQYQTCSQGEKQRLMIARGLMPSPELLLLDEPTNGLDFIARENLLTSIQQLIKENNAPTIIFVTHHIEEVLPEFSHTLLLRGGTVFSKGISQEVISTENMSEFFNIPVNVSWHHERPWLSRRD